jgi:hypothetical protein
MIAFDYDPWNSDLFVEDEHAYSSKNSILTMCRTVVPDVSAYLLLPAWLHWSGSKSRHAIALLETNTRIRFSDPTSKSKQE